MKLLTCLLPFVGVFSLFVETRAYQNRPAVIMAPGAFHRPQVYDMVCTQLRQAGYNDLTAIELPSLGELVNRPRDVGVVTSLLDMYLGDGRDVLLVGNSYGATVIGEAVKNYTSDAYHPSMGIQEPSASPTTKYGHSYKRGRILGLMFLSGYIPYITEVTQPQLRPDITKVSPSFFRFDNGKVSWDNDLKDFPPQKTFYNRLPARESDYWSKQLYWTSYSALNATATYIPYTGDFRVVYVIGNQDNSVPPTFAKTYIDQPGAKFIVETIDGDHVPMLSLPDEVVGLVRKYAEVQ